MVMLVSAVYHRRHLVWEKVMLELYHTAKGGSS